MFNKKSKAKAPAPPAEPQEWTGEVEEGEESEEDKSKKIAELEDQLEKTKAETQTYNNAMAEPGVPEVQQPEVPVAGGQPPVKENQQARVRQVVQRADGFFETLIESNYVFANTGDNL